MNHASEQFENTAPPEPAAADQGELVARPDKRYRRKHLIMAVALILAGGWFAYDGWIGWPEQNRLADETTVKFEAAQRATPRDEKEVERLAAELKKYEKHNDAAILLQKFLAFACPAFGIFWGAWTLRDTRGAYRMTGTTLHVPGHPPVSVDDVRRIDKRKWDKKGIAYLHYEAGTPPTAGVLKLDDFAYERKPTDEMLERIEKNVLSTVATDVAPATRA